MKTQKQNMLLIGNTTPTYSALNKLMLQSKSSRNLKSINKSNLSNILSEQRSKSKKAKCQKGESINERNSSIKLLKQIKSNLKTARNNGSNPVSIQSSAKKEDLPTVKNRKQEESNNKSLRLAQQQGQGNPYEEPQLQKKRPHFSQNLQRKNSKAQSQVIHRKLYTFCQEPNKANTTANENKKCRYDKEQEKGMQVSRYIGGQHHFCSTIVVKQQELKRFTQKFARQKIQFEQTIQNMRIQIQQLKILNQQLSFHRQSLQKMLQIKLCQNEDLCHQKQNFFATVDAMKLREQSLITSCQQKLQQNRIKVTFLQNDIEGKNKLINQLLKQLQAKDTQIQKLQCENRQSKILFPLTNVHHINSICSLVQHQFSPQIQSESFEQMEFLKQEIKNAKMQQKSTKHLSQYLQIENNYIMKQLQLQRMTCASMKEQIEQLNNKILQLNHAILEYKAVQEKEYDKHHLQQIDELRQQNQNIKHSRQILQRSLRVSSDMIQNLKHQNSVLRQDISGLQTKNRIKQSEQPTFTLEHIKQIVRFMMKQQLQLEDKLNPTYLSQKTQNRTFICNEHLQKKYEQGYQSIKQLQKNRNRRKKTQSHQQSNKQYYSRKQHTQVSEVDQFNIASDQYRSLCSQSYLF